METSIESGSRYRVKNRLLGGRKFIVEAREYVQSCDSWWCLVVRGGRASYEWGWRAFRSDDLEEMK